MSNQNSWIIKGFEAYNDFSMVNWDLYKSTLKNTSTSRRLQPSSEAENHHNNHTHCEMTAFPNGLPTVEYGCWTKNMGKTPKWMVYNGKPIKMDDLGVPLFLETPISWANRNRFKFHSSHSNSTRHSAISWNHTLSFMVPCIIFTNKTVHLKRQSFSNISVFHTYISTIMHYQKKTSVNLWNLIYTPEV